jgi:uncharacterized protein (TIGR02271 family)
LTRAESPARGRSFPGAHSAVPGRHTLPFTSEESSAGGRNTLPLEAVPISTAHGWSIRLPVHAERVTVSKDVVVRERVVVCRRELADVAHVHAEVRREELRTSTEGEIEVVDTQDERTKRL